MSIVTLYVPRPDSPIAKVIPQGAAVVGSLAPIDGNVRLDFESNPHGADNLPNWEDWVERVTHRHLNETNAEAQERLFVPSRYVQEIGTVQETPAGKRINLRQDAEGREVIARWLENVPRRAVAGNAAGAGPTKAG